MKSEIRELLSADGEVRSGMIEDKEVEMHKLSEFEWTIDIVQHTSDDAKELLEGYLVEDEDEALALYDDKVKMLLDKVVA